MPQIAQAAASLEGVSQSEGKAKIAISGTSSDPFGEWQCMLLPAATAASTMFNQSYMPLFLLVG